MRRIWRIIRAIPEIISFLYDVIQYLEKNTKSKRAKALEERGKALLARLK